MKAGAAPFLKSLAQASELKNKYVLSTTVGKIREGIHTKTHIQTHSGASEPLAAQGVGGCVCGSNKATRLQAQSLACSYKEPGPSWEGGAVWWVCDKDGLSPCQLPLSHKTDTSAGGGQPPENIQQDREGHG